MHARECVHHTSALRGDGGGWGKLLAFQVIRKRQNTRVMSFTPSLQPIISPGRRGWPNVWLRRVLTASRGWVLRGKVHWIGWKRIAWRLGSAPRCCERNQTKPDDALEQSAAGQIKAADRVSQQVGRLPLLYFSMVIK